MSASETEFEDKTQNATGAPTTSETAEEGPTPQDAIGELIGVVEACLRNNDRVAKLFVTQEMEQPVRQALEQYAAEKLRCSDGEQITPETLVGEIEVGTPPGGRPLNYIIASHLQNRFLQESAKEFLAWLEVSWKPHHVSPGLPLPLVIDEGIMRQLVLLDLYLQFCAARNMAIAQTRRVTPASPGVQLVQTGR